MKGLRALTIAGTALAVLAINVALSVLYVAVYGFVINPGQSPQFYRDHAQVAAPYCSVIAGIPLMYFAGRFLARRSSPQHAVVTVVLMWAVYAAIDLAFLVMGQRTMRLLVFTAISLATKLAAAYVGARTARAPEDRVSATYGTS